MIIVEPRSEGTPSPTNNIWLRLQKWVMSAVFKSPYTAHAPYTANIKKNVFIFWAVLLKGIFAEPFNVKKRASVTVVSTDGFQVHGWGKPSAINSVSKAYQRCATDIAAESKNDLAISYIMACERFWLFKRMKYRMVNYKTIRTLLKWNARFAFSALCFSSTEAACVKILPLQRTYISDKYRGYH